MFSWPQRVSYLSLFISPQGLVTRSATGTIGIWTVWRWSWTSPLGSGVGVFVVWKTCREATGWFEFSLKSCFLVCFFTWKAKLSWNIFAEIFATELKAFQQVLADSTSQNWVFIKFLVSLRFTFSLKTTYTSGKKTLAYQLVKIHQQFW